MTSAQTVRRVARLTLLYCSIPYFLGTVAAYAQGSPKPKRVEWIRLIAPGGRVAWSGANSLIAFDRMGDDGFSDLYTMSPDTTKLTCLSCALPMTVGHVGNPAWNPAGTHVVFQAQNTALAFLPPEKQPIAMRMTSPGWGTNNNLWIMTSTGQSPVQLTNVAAGMGVLHPYFSRSGSHLIWAEKTGLVGLAEQWTIKIAAAAIEGGRVVLKNVTQIQPFGPNFFYETHGFTADDKKIVFSGGDPANPAFDIFTFELATGKVQNLTNSPEYDEHAIVSPDGQWIVWSSAKDISRPRSYFVPYMDYWRMRVDGSGKERLTYFNDPAAPEYSRAGGIVTTDFSWAPDGSGMVCRLEVTADEATQRVTELIALIKF